jgi:hypothetical protein
LEEEDGACDHSVKKRGTKSKRQRVEISEDDIGSVETDAEPAEVEVVVMEDDEEEVSINHNL